jgi:hypothetical protein
LKLDHFEDYRALRRAAYPSVQDQLDALWHAMNTLQVPVAEPFYSTIKAIKQKYPKTP